MKSLQPIYTEKNNCQDCYKCIRECPVKAIKIEADSASVVHELCVYCGHCTMICPVGAKKIRDDITRVKQMVLSEKVIVSLAPSFCSEFPGISATTLIAAIKELGVYAVSETALGAELVTHETSHYLAAQQRGIFISGCCPSVVELIQKYYPQYSGLIVPVMSPMLAHARFLRTQCEENVRIVFAGPCIAKKKEADDCNGLVDAVITFERLRAWFDEEGIDLLSMEEQHKEDSFFPYPAKDGTLYPVDGGMISGIRKDVSVTDLSFMSFSGMLNVKEVLNGLEQWKGKGRLFLELLSCENGCINGPGTTQKRSPALKRFEVLKQLEGRKGEAIEEQPVSLKRSYAIEKGVVLQRHTAEEVTDALQSVGKLSPRDELNCGSCGYDSCRDFAVAMLEGRAERNMCVSYMRKVAHNKSNVLLQRMPAGVVLVDEQLEIIDSNRKFAELLGEDGVLAAEAKPGLVGADLKKFIPFHKMFASVIQSGEEKLERDVRTSSAYYHVSIFTVQMHKIVCGIIQNLRDPDVNRQMVQDRTREVIHRNMEVVQQIAYLLGENASYTETMLNTIVNTQDTNETGDEQEFYN